MRFRFDFLLILTDGLFPHELMIKSSPDFSPQLLILISCFQRALSTETQLQLRPQSQPTSKSLGGPTLSFWSAPSHPGLSLPGLAAWNLLFPLNLVPAAHLLRPSNQLLAISEMQISWDPPHTPESEPWGGGSPGTVPFYEARPVATMPSQVEKGEDIF